MCCTSWRQRLMSHSYKSNWFSWIWKIEGWREINPKDLRKCSKVNTFLESKLGICTIFGFHLVFGESSVLWPTVAFTLATPRGGRPAWHQTSVWYLQVKIRKVWKLSWEWKQSYWQQTVEEYLDKWWFVTHTHNPHRHFRNNTNPYLNPRMNFFS